MFNKIKETLRRRRNMNNTIHELQRLSDHELNDLGIGRGDIQRVARGVIDFHRTIRDINEAEDV